MTIQFYFLRKIFTLNGLRFFFLTMEQELHYTFIQMIHEYTIIEFYNCVV